MNNSKDNFCTPKQTKRLGLRRSSSTLGNSSTKSGIAAGKSKKDGIETPGRMTCKLPHSDVKINYKSIEIKEHYKNNTVCTTNTPATPKSQCVESTRRAASTSCRPYRLSLSKKVREKMTKKRLEFHLANEMEKEEDRNKDKDGNAEQSVESNGLTKEELLAQIEIARKELATRQDHVKKVEELQQAIDVWKTGFSAALQDLRQRIGNRLEIPPLLDHLKIPQEMAKYIND